MLKYCKVFIFTIIIHLKITYLSNYSLNYSLL